MTDKDGVSPRSQNPLHSTPKLYIDMVHNVIGWAGGEPDVTIRIKHDGWAVIREGRWREIRIVRKGICWWRLVVEARADRS
jgi:hypothetical protein